MEKSWFVLILLIASAVCLSGCYPITKPEQSASLNIEIPPAEKKIPIAPQDVFDIDNSRDYVGQTFRFQGCFEPHTCSMASELCVINKGGIKIGCTNKECGLDNLGLCCDCIQNYNKCPIVDLQSVAKEKLIELRKTNQTKYYVEVVGTVVISSRMRPVSVKATDITILGDCPAKE